MSTNKIDEFSDELNIENLKPKKVSKLCPQGAQTFTMLRQADETGVSGTGVVLEGVQFTTGQVVAHWLTCPPRGSLAIFDSYEDFINIHVKSHLVNKTVITWDDGTQEIYDETE